MVLSFLSADASFEFLTETFVFVIRLVVENRNWWWGTCGSQSTTENFWCQENTEEENSLEGI